LLSIFWLASSGRAKKIFFGDPRYVINLHTNNLLRKRGGRAPVFFARGPPCRRRPRIRRASGAREWDPVMVDHAPTRPDFRNFSINDLMCNAAGGVKNSTVKGGAAAKVVT